jgi:F0F1-type ATP synthase membrane subunit b/b'
VNYEQIAIWSQVISSFLFLGVIVWMWFRFAQPAVLAAQVAQNERIAQAERHRDEAKAAVELLQAEIDGADRDADAIRRRAVDQAGHERDAMLVEAREAGERALRSAQGELDRARAAARVRLRTELLNQAIELARTEAPARVNAALNAKLVSDFVGSLERRQANRG